MRKIKLESVYTIKGIGCASGLIYQDNSLFLISDNSTYLYEYEIIENKLKTIPLFKNCVENIPKKEKSDFESITIKENKLFVFGSGSTSNRNQRISYNLETKKIKVKNISSNYEKLKQKALFSDMDLNIEGAFFHNRNWYFFQRGNGSKSKNGIFISNKEKNEIHFFSIHLPKIQHIEATFTDAILLGEHIYFLAAAENTNSTYDDGDILGSFIGCLSLNNLQIVFTKQISDKLKFEGLTLFKDSQNEIEFLLCEDNDTEVLETIIYKLILSK